MLTHLTWTTSIAALRFTARIVRSPTNLPWCVPGASRSGFRSRDIDFWSSSDENRTFYRCYLSRRLCGWLQQLFQDRCRSWRSRRRQRCSMLLNDRYLLQDSCSWCRRWRILLCKQLLNVSRSWRSQQRKGLLCQQLLKVSLTRRSQQRKGLLCQQLHKVSLTRRSQQRKGCKPIQLPIFRWQWLRQVQLTKLFLPIEPHIRSVKSRSGCARGTIISG